MEKETITLIERANKHLTQAELGACGKVWDWGSVREGVWNARRLLEKAGAAGKEALDMISDVSDDFLADRINKANRLLLTIVCTEDFKAAGYTVKNGRVIM